MVGNSRERGKLKEEGEESVGYFGISRTSAAYPSSPASDVIRHSQAVLFTIHPLLKPTTPSRFC